MKLKTNVGDTYTFAFAKEIHMGFFFEVFWNRILGLYSIYNFFIFWRRVIKF